MRQASESEVVRWVADNLSNLKATPEDAPAPRAWALLQDCRGDADFRRDKFWPLVYGKLAGADEDEIRQEVNRLTDHGQTLKLLEKVMDGLVQGRSEGPGEES